MDYLFNFNFRVHGNFWKQPNSLAIQYHSIAVKTNLQLCPLGLEEMI